MAAAVRDPVPEAEMSNNQKQAATGGPPQRYPPPGAPYPQGNQQREYQVTTPYVSHQQVLSQPPNQGGNQGPPLRTLQSNGPPNQSSTPPNVDIKVQPTTITPMQFPTRPTYFRSANPTSQPRMPSQHNRPTQQLYQPQYISQMPQQYTLVSAPMYYPQSQRPPNFPPQTVPAMFTGQSMYPYGGHPSIQAQPTGTYFATQTWRPTAPPQQPAGMPQNTAQPTLTSMSMPAMTSTMPYQRQQNKRRSKAVPIIDPNTGEDRLNEMYEESSHNQSGESSARQTPQPSPHNNNSKEVQATFVKQVYQSMANDAANVAAAGGGGSGGGVGAADHVATGAQAAAVPVPDHQHPHHHHHPPHGAPDTEHDIAGNHLEQGTGPINTSPYQAVQQRDLDQIAQSSNLTVHAKEFVCSNISSKETTPVVSALSNATEVTLPVKQSKETRESPGKARKQQQQQQQQKEVKDNSSEKQRTGNSNKDDNKLSQQPQLQQTSVPSSNVATAAAALTAAGVKDNKDIDKRNNRKDNKNDTKVPSVDQSESAITVTNQQQMQNAQDSSKSKNANRIVNQKPTAPQNNNQKVSAPAVPAPQPPKANNKSQKKNELNMKGASKEGTDMDAFNDNSNTTTTNIAAAANQQQQAVNVVEDAANANVITANNNNNNTSNIAPPTATTTVPINTQNSNDIINANNTQIQQDNNNETLSNKKSDSNEAVTIKETKPKLKVDVTAIVKDNKTPQMKPLMSATTTAAGLAAQKDNDQTNLDETDRMVSTDKMLQTKNDLNAKVNANEVGVKDPNKISLSDLPYDDDQWSPSNQSGKKVYQKDFLMAVRRLPAAKKQPPNLPDYIKADDRSRYNDRASMGGRTDFAPAFGGSYGGKSNSQRGVPPKRNSQSKLSNSGNKRPTVKVSISVREDVKLHETENAWRPARFVKGDNMSEDEKKTEELYKKVRGVLNKLTPQKFETLISQVRELQIDTEERLQGVIDLVFEKAVDEPNFSVAYALMCKELAMMQVPTSTTANVEKKEYVNFRKLLVTRCQVEFEKQSIDESVRNEKVKEIEECTDPEKKKELQFDLEEYDRRLRMKSVGNIRFIGELFKKNMLTVNIMLRCLNNLLTNRDEESLECLCKLLTTIGKEMEMEKKVDLSDIFNTMKDIVDSCKKKVSSRVRFMLQDVIDLRQSKWVPRRQDLNPKTIDQIQKEAENEQFNIQAMNSMPIQSRNKDDRGSMSGGNSDRKRGKNINDDGWVTTVASNQRNRAPIVINPIHFDKLKNKPPDNEISLGSAQMHSMWSRGSNLKTPSTNSFSLLENMDPEKKIGSGGSGNSGGNNSRSGRREPYNSKGPSLERSYGSYEGRGSRGGSRAGSRSGSQQRSNESSLQSQSVTPTPKISQPQLQPTPAASAIANLSDDQLQRRFTNALQEYINGSAKYDEMEEEIRTDIPPSFHTRYVYECITFVLEKSVNFRTKTGGLFAKLVKNSVISVEDYYKGLEELISQADDLIIDIPKFWDCIAEIIVEAINEEVLTLTKLHSICKDLLSNGHGPRLLPPLFKLLVDTNSVGYLHKIWSKSGLKLNDWMPAQQVPSFIENNQLEYLESDDSGPKTPNIERFQFKLQEFFDSDTPVDKIISWIDDYVGDQVKDVKFIRALATAIFENSIKRNKLAVDVITRHYKLLQKYVDNDATLELQCLYALQALINKLEHPQGLLFSICNQLYEDGVFSQESFITWEQSTDPAEFEGKGVALKQLTSFFTQLKENDIDDENDENDDVDNSSTSEDMA